jgi:hypothetical protein
MGNKRLYEFTALTGYTNLAADDLVYVADHSSSDGERKVVLSDIKNYVLNGKTVGGSGTGDIIDNSSQQSLAFKTLTSPTINTPIIATPAISAATLTGNTVLPATTTIGSVDATEISHLNGVTHPIQTQLNALSAIIGDISARVFCYGVTFVAAGTSADEISAATIIAGASVPSGYIISPTTVMVQMSTVSGGTFTKIDEVTAPVVWESATDGHGTYLTKIKPSLVNGTTYNITVHFKVTAELA